MPVKCHVLRRSQELRLKTALPQSATDSCAVPKIYACELHCALELYALWKCALKLRFRSAVRLTCTKRTLGCLDLPEQPLL